MKKITILHSTTNWLAQTQTWIYSQIKNTNPDTFESHVSCESILNLDQFPLENIHVRDELSFFRKKILRLQERLLLLRRSAHVLLTGNKIQAQIIHSHFGDIGWRDIPAVKELGCKHVVTFYGFDVNQLPMQQPIWKERYKELFESADIFLCEGAFMAQSLVKLGCDKSKIIVQHLGVNINNLIYKPRNWQEGETFKILIAASFREKKGIPFALKAIANIKDKVAIEITIIGGANDKPSSIKEKEVILRTIKEEKLAPYVTLLGFQPHHVMIEEAYKHHLFISPSVTAKDGDSEGGAPVSIIEMIAIGMIVISTKHCDIPEVAQYPDKNWLVDERDSKALSKQIRWLIKNPAQWKSMQEQARIHIEENYDSKIQGERLTDIYKSLIKKDTANE